MNAPESMAHLSKKIVLILDLRDRDNLSTQWRRIWGCAFTTGIGGILIRGGTVSAWRYVREILDLIHPRPLLMADLEQGIASQMHAYSWLPSAFSIGATNDTKLAHRAGELAGRQARAGGLDVILAPVADLCLELSSRVLGVRCFGATPQRTSGMVAAFIQGCQEQGVGTVAKHFPGHGRTSVDSHEALPEITGDLELWERTDMPPFSAAIGAGCWGVMAGHILMRCFDASRQRPASESNPVLTGLLRGHLGFRGRILTDSLDMAPVAPGGLAVAQRAVSAGADLVLGVQELPDSPCVPSRIPEEPNFDEFEKTNEVMSVLDEEVDDLAAATASRSIAWTIRTSVNLKEMEQLPLLYVCTDGADGGWAESFVHALRERLHGLSVRYGPLSAFDCQGGSSVVLAMGRFSKEIQPEAIRAGVFCDETKVIIIPVIFGALWLLESFESMPVLLAGDTLDMTQRAAAAILLGEERPRGILDIRI